MDKHLVSIKDRIINKINFVDDCWIWNGSTRHKDSYPSIGINKKSFRVREITLNEFIGVDVPSNMDIRSNCENLLCVNPNHLYFDMKFGRPSKLRGIIKDKEPIENRFWKFVDKKSDEECWEWLGSLDGKGYGQFNIASKNCRSHRLVYKFKVGDPTGYEVCHKCDNRKCCNPNHLFLGIHKDNMADMALKGRIGKVKALGENHGNAKLKNSDIIKIRNLYSGGNYTYDELAINFHISKTTCWRIIKGLAWKSI